MRLQRSLSSFLFSLLSHAAVFLVFLVLFSDTFKPQEKKTPTLLVEVDPGRPLRSRGHSSSKPVSGHRSHGALPRLNQLGIKIPTGESRGSSFTSDELWGSGGFDLEMDRHYSFLRALYQRIEAHLVYPIELKKAGIEGSVRARLRFNSDGQYLPRESQFQSGSPYLRVAVIQILRKALESPIALARSTPPLPEVDCSFYFEFTESNSHLALDRPKMILGNSLAFFRTHPKSKLEWKLGPLRGVLPFPQIGVDLQWFGDRAEDFLTKRERIDPLEKYRRDPEW